MVRIWGRRSSINVQKVLWTCDELTLAYEQIDAGGAFSRLDTTEFRALNPNARVPVMDDDGFVLWESNSIVRYIAAKYGMGNLCPSELAKRADAERWMDWQLSQLLPDMKALFFGLVRATPAERDETIIQQAQVGAERSWRILNEHLLHRRFVTGEHFTMADIPLGAFAYRWLALPIARPVLPGILAWYERLGDRNGFRRHVMLPLE